MSAQIVLCFFLARAVFHEEIVSALFFAARRHLSLSTIPMKRLKWVSGRKERRVEGGQERLKVIKHSSWMGSFRG